jgi:Domain of unknown function (DUF4249)
MKFNHFFQAIFILAITILTSCNLTKDVEIELPAYEAQPVVECYLEPGKPFRMLLTKSSYFFSQFNLDSNFLQNTLLDSANVSISNGTETFVLRNDLVADFSPLKIFNYSSSEIVPATAGVTYTLSITLTDGRTVTAQTTMLPFVAIDSVVVQRSPTIDSISRMLTYVTDDQTQPNYYRRMINYGSLDSSARQDFTINDRISQTKTLAFGTGYDFVKGDTIFNTIFHIEKAYYDYKESIQNAIGGSLNPFAQPSQIVSNVSGSANPLGIFTCLVYDRKRTIVE